MQSFFVQSSAQYLIRVFLRHQVGQWLEGLDDQNILLHGLNEFVVENIQLKTDCLKEYMLPFTVKKGSLSKLSVFWLTTTTALIEVDDLNICLGPTHETMESLDNRRFADKRRKLERWESVLHSMTNDNDASGRTPSSNNGEDSGYRMRIIRGLLNGLEVVFRRINISYEEESFCTFCLTIDEIRIQNESSPASPENKENSRLQKQFSVHNIGLKILTKNDDDDNNDNDSNDHDSYVLRPLSATASLRMLSAGSQQIDISLPKLEMDVDKGQVTALSDLVDDWTFRSRWNLPKPHRPQYSRPTTDPAAWWRFAIQSTLDNIRRSSAEQLAEWSQDKLRYQDLYIEKTKTGTLNPPELQEEFDELERKRSFQEIVCFRCVALRKIARDQQAEKQKQEKAEKDNEVAAAAATAATSSSSNRGWTYYLPTGLFSKKQKEIADDVSFLKLTSEEHRELLIAFDSLKESSSSQHGSGGSTVEAAYKYSFQIGVLQVRLFQSGRDRMEMSAVLYHGAASCHIINKSLQLDGSIGGFCIDDPKNNRTLLRGGHKEIAGVACGKFPLFTVKFKYDWSQFPIYVMAHVKSGQVECILDVAWWLQISRFFQLGKPTEIDPLRSAVADTYEKVTEQSQESAFCRQLDIDFDIAAPNLCFPDVNFSHSESTAALLIKLGNIRMKNAVNSNQQQDFHLERVSNFFLLETSNVEIAFIPELSMKDLNECSLPLPSTSSRLLSNVHLSSNLQVSVPMYSSGPIIAKVESNVSRTHLKISPQQLTGISRIMGSLYWSLESDTSFVPTKAPVVLQGKMLVQGANGRPSWCWRWVELGGVSKTEISFLPRAASRWPEAVVSLVNHHVSSRQISEGITAILIERDDNAVRGEDNDNNNNNNNNDHSYENSNDHSYDSIGLSHHGRTRGSSILMVVGNEHHSRWMDALLQARASATHGRIAEDFNAAVALTRKKIEPEVAAASATSSTVAATSSTSSDEISLGLNIEDLFCFIVDAESNQTIFRSQIKQVTSSYCTIGTHRKIDVAALCFQIDKGLEQQPLIRFSSNETEGNALSVNFEYWKKIEEKVPNIKIRLNESYWCVNPDALKSVTRIARDVRATFGSASHGLKTVRIVSATLSRAAPTCSLRKIPDNLPKLGDSFVAVMFVDVALCKMKFVFEKSEMNSVAKLTFGSGMIGTAQMGFGGMMSASGTVGSLTFEDDTPAGKLHPIVIGMEESETLGKFHLEVFDRLDIGYPGFDGKLAVDVNRICINLLTRYYEDYKAYMDILFPPEQQQQNSLMSPASSSLTMSTELKKPSDSRFLFEANLTHPQLIIPSNSLSQKAIVVDLGTIKVANSYVTTDDGVGVTSVAIRCTDVIIRDSQISPLASDLATMPLFATTIQWATNDSSEDEDQGFLLVPFAIDFDIPVVSASMTDRQYEIVMAIAFENLTEYPIGTLKKAYPEGGSTKWPNDSELANFHQEAINKSGDQSAGMRFTMVIGQLNLIISYVLEDVVQPMTRITMNTLEWKMDFLNALPDIDALSWEFKMQVHESNIKDAREGFADRMLPLFNVTSPYLKISPRDFWKLSSRRGNDNIRFCRQRHHTNPDDKGFLYVTITKTNSSHKKSEILLGETAILLDLYALWGILDYLLKGNAVGWRVPPTCFEGDDSNPVVEYAPRVDGTIFTSFSSQFARIYLLADFSQQTGLMDGILHEGQLNGQYVLQSSISTRWNIAVKEFQTFSGKFAPGQQQDNGSDDSKDRTRRELHKKCTFFLLNSWNDFDDNVEVEWSFRLWEALLEITYEDIVLGIQVFKNVFGGDSSNADARQSQQAKGVDEEEEGDDEEVTTFSNDQEITTRSSTPRSSTKPTNYTWRVSLNDVSCVFINDYQHRWIPLLFLEFPFFIYQQAYHYPFHPRLDQFSYEYDCKSSVVASWYMLGEGGWEKLLDNITVKVDGQLQSGASRMKVTIEEWVELQVTFALAFMVKSTLDGWYSDSRPWAPLYQKPTVEAAGSRKNSFSQLFDAENKEQEEKKKDSGEEYVPRAVKNMTGMTMTCRLSGISCVVQPGETRGFQAQEIDLALGTPLQISLLFGSEFEPVYTVIADLVAERILKLRRKIRGSIVIDTSIAGSLEEDEDLNILCNLDIVEGTSVLTVWSTVVLHNDTNSHIECSVVDTRDCADVLKRCQFLLQPKSKEPIPLPLVARGRLFVRRFDPKAAHQHHMWTRTSDSLSLVDVVRGHARLSQVLDEDFELRLKNKVPAQTRLMASFKCQLRSSMNLKRNWLMGRLYICDTCYVHWNEADGYSLLLTSNISSVEKTAVPGDTKRVLIKTAEEDWTLRHLGENLEKAFRILLREAHRTNIRSLSVGSGQSCVSLSLQLLLGSKPVFTVPCSMEDQFGHHKGNLATSMDFVGFSSIDDLVQHVIPWTDVDSLNVIAGKVPLLCIKDKEGNLQLRLQSASWDLDTIVEVLLTVWRAPRSGESKEDQQQHHEEEEEEEGGHNDLEDQQVQLLKQQQLLERTPSSLSMTTTNLMKPIKQAFSTLNLLTAKKDEESHEQQQQQQSILEFFHEEDDHVECFFECQIEDGSVVKGDLLATKSCMIFMSKNKQVWMRIAWFELSALDLDANGVIVADLKNKAHRLCVKPLVPHKEEIFSCLASIWVSAHQNEMTSPKISTVSTSSLTELASPTALDSRRKNRYASIESPPGSLMSSSFEMPFPIDNMANANSNSATLTVNTSLTMTTTTATNTTATTASTTPLSLTPTRMKSFDVSLNDDDNNEDEELSLVPKKDVMLKIECTLNSPTDLTKEGCIWVTEESITFLSIDRELFCVLPWVEVMEVLKKNTKLVLQNAIFIRAKNDCRSLLLSSNKWQRDRVLELMRPLPRLREQQQQQGEGSAALNTSNLSEEEKIKRKIMDKQAVTKFVFAADEGIVCNELALIHPLNHEGHLICSTKFVCFWDHITDATLKIPWFSVEGVNVERDRTVLAIDDGKWIESMWIGAAMAMQLSSIASVARQSLVLVESPTDSLPSSSTAAAAAAAAASENASSTSSTSISGKFKKIGFKFQQFGKKISDKISTITPASSSSSPNITSPAQQQQQQQQQQLMSSATDGEESIDAKFLQLFGLSADAEILFCLPCMLQIGSASSSNSNNNNNNNNSASSSSSSSSISDVPAIRGHVAATKEYMLFLSLDTFTRRRVDWLNEIKSIHKKKDLLDLSKSIVIKMTGDNAETLQLTGNWKRSTVLEMFLSAQREAQPGGDRSDVGGVGASGGGGLGVLVGKGIRRPQCITSQAFTSTCSSPGSQRHLAASDDSPEEPWKLMPFRCCVLATSLSKTVKWSKGHPVQISFLPPIMVKNLLASAVEIKWGDNKKDLVTETGSGSGPWVKIESGERLELSADLKWSLWIKMRIQGARRMSTPGKSIAGNSSGSSSSSTGAGADTIFRAHRASSEQKTVRVVLEAIQYRLPVTVTVGTKTAGNIRVDIRPDYWIVNASGLTLDMAVDNATSAPILLPPSKQPIDFGFVDESSDNQTVCFRTTFIHDDVSLTTESVNLDGDSLPPWSDSVQPRNMLARPKWVLAKPRPKKGSQRLYLSTTQQQQAAALNLSTSSSGSSAIGPSSTSAASSSSSSKKSSQATDTTSRFLSVAVLPAEGQFWRTFCITIGPPVLLDNQLLDGIEVAQWIGMDTRPGTLCGVERDKTKAFVCVGNPMLCSIVFRKSGNEDWSNPFAIGNPGDVWIDNVHLERVCIRISSIPNTMTVAVRFAAATGKAPHRIVNRSSHTIVFRQHILLPVMVGAAEEAFNRIVRGKPATLPEADNQCPWQLVGSGEECDVILFDACAPPVFQIKSDQVQGFSAVVDMRELQRPPVVEGSALSLELSLEGSSFTLTVSDHGDKIVRILTKRASLLNSRNSRRLSLSRSFSYSPVAESSSTSSSPASNYFDSSSFSISVQGLGLLLLGEKEKTVDASARRQQLLYVSAQCFSAVVNTSKNKRQFIMQASSLQIDDEDPTARFPVLLKAHPIVPTAAANIDAPCISLFVAQKMEVVDPLFIQRCELRVGRAEVCFDDAIVIKAWKLMNVLKVKFGLMKKKDSGQIQAIAHVPWSTKVLTGSDNVATRSAGRVYLEYFSITPLQLDLVLFFNSHHESSHMPSLMTQVGQVGRFVMNVPLQVQFNAKGFSVQKVLRTNEEFNSMLRSHYSKEAMKQVGRFIRQAVKGMVSNWTRKLASTAETQTARKVRKITFHN